MKIMHIYHRRFGKHRKVQRKKMNESLIIPPIQTTTVFWYISFPFFHAYVCKCVEIIYYIRSSLFFSHLTFHCDIIKHHLQTWLLTIVWFSVTWRDPRLIIQLFCNMVARGRVIYNFSLSGWWICYDWLVYWFWLVGVLVIIIIDWCLCHNSY